GVHIPRVREPPADILARPGGGDQLHPQARLNWEWQRVGVVQPRLTIGEVHDIGKPCKGEKCSPRLPAWVFKLQHRPAVVHLAFKERPAPPGAPGRGPARRGPRGPEGPGGPGPKKPRAFVGISMRGSNRARAERPAKPL